jgi:hypothetical protein
MEAVSCPIEPNPFHKKIPAFSCSLYHVFVPDPVIVFAQLSAKHEIKTENKHRKRSQIKIASLYFLSTITKLSLSDQAESSG